MRQILFHLHLFNHDIPIYGYGLMLVVAFLACVKLSRWLAGHNGMNPDHFVDACLIALATGIIGARLCHVLENFHEYARPDLTVVQNLRNIFNTREGGLTFYGGFLLATPCCIAYALWRRVKLLHAMDIVAPVVMIGLGFGRIGCFLNGCCYGEQCTLPWAVQFPYDSNAYRDQYDSGKLVVPAELLNPNGSPRPIADNARLAAIAASSRALPVHPTELYSSFTAFLLMALLIAYLTLPHIDGRVFALMFMLEGFARYVLEMIRVEPAVATVHWGAERYGLSISMVLAAIVFAAGVVMWTVLGQMPHVDRVD